MQFPFVSGLPMPSPMVMLGGGPAAVIVTVTVPGVVTMNECTLNAPGCTTSENVTVTTVAEGATTFDELLDPPHAAALATTTDKPAAMTVWVRRVIPALRWFRQAYNQRRVPCGDTATARDRRAPAGGGAG